jgi:hypothetical protein
MEHTEPCEIKVVDYKTNYIAIGAYDDNDEDEEIKYGEPRCEYAIIRADDNLLKALNDIKNYDLKLIAGNLCDSSLIKLIDQSSYYLIVLFHFLGTIHSQILKLNCISPFFTLKNVETYSI